MSILRDAGLALAQMTDRRFLRVLLLGLALTIGLLVAVTWGFLWLVGGLVPDSMTLPWIGSVDFADGIASAATIGLMLVLSVFLMVPVATAFTGFFLDDVAVAVESRYYPQLPPAQSIPFGEAMRDSIAFLGVVIAVNLVAIVLYFFVGPFAPVMFWIVNGYLLGREYFQLVAMRRVGRDGARAARRRHMSKIWLAGTLMAAPLSVPIVNLFVPILGAATFTHLYHRLETKVAPRSVG
jgi:uncharacterized protein involved in cysteine biosynthesis